MTNPTLTCPTNNVGLNIRRKNGRKYNGYNETFCFILISGLGTNHLSFGIGDYFPSLSDNHIFVGNENSFFCKNTSNLMFIICKHLI
jgi:hypothetical protein